MSVCERMNLMNSILDTAQMYISMAASTALSGFVVLSVILFIIDGIKVDFVNYSRYPWIDEAVVEDGIRLASPKDIAAMKTYAIQNRGTLKDFIDYYFLLQHFSLEEILGFYAQKYPNHSMFRTRMALTYFEDAENKECPPMFINADWNDIKSFISQKVREIDWEKFE